MRDQRASSAVRHKQGLRPCAFERLVEPGYPLAAVRGFSVILDNTAAVLFVLYERSSLLRVDVVSDAAGNSHASFPTYRFSQNNVTTHSHCSCARCTKPHKLAPIYLQR